MTLAHSREQRIEELEAALREIVQQSEEEPPCTGDINGYDWDCSCDGGNSGDVEYHGVRNGYSRAADIARRALLSPASKEEQG